ncbi:phage tail assembly chaperone [Hungatella sp.]|uniref:phage tail assembly chaperone n=1 Tax=Hungatella sp. TaxID=2613924 RepID=UPI003996AA10
MGSLNAFLHPEQTENREVFVSNRFKENGKPVPFVIRPITQQENEGLIKKYTKRDKKGNETFDRVAYNQELNSSSGGRTRT